MKLTQMRDKLAKDYAWRNAEEYDVKAFENAVKEGWDRAILESRRRTGYSSLLGAIINVLLQELLVVIYHKTKDMEKETKF